VSSPAPGRDVPGYKPPTSPTHGYVLLVVFESFTHYFVLFVFRSASVGAQARRGTSLSGTSLSRGIKRLFTKARLAEIAKTQSQQQQHTHRKHSIRIVVDRVSMLPRRRQRARTTIRDASAASKRLAPAHRRSLHCVLLHNHHLVLLLVYVVVFDYDFVL
jgi:hypothetical protein